MYILYCLIVIYAAALCPSTESARILAIFPAPFVSHQMIFRTLTTALSKRGHELVVFTTNPMNDPNLKNYTEIDLSSFHAIKRDKMNSLDLKSQRQWRYRQKYAEILSEASERIFSHPTLQRLVKNNSTEKFDLILLQYTRTDGFFALSIIFDAPVITVITHNSLPYQYYVMGNPLVVASTPYFFSEYTDDMNFWQRTLNFCQQVSDVLNHRAYCIPQQDRFVKKYLGDNFPSTSNLILRNSMFFVYNHPFFMYPHPHYPAILHFGGCRRPGERKNLPEDVKEFVDNAKEGFVYFSMGTNVESGTFSADMRNMFLATFAELPYRVIWKFEGDLPDKPDNVIIKKWLPQREILAHPNIRLFMYQGGLQSTEEAIYSNVPMLAFPVVSDQYGNVKRLEHYRAAKALNIFTVDKRTLKNAIVEVATNSSYKEGVKKLANLLRDLPYDPLDNAVWWTEHVIRHKGAPHLYNKHRDLPFYKRELLDVLTLLFLTIAVFLYLAFLLLRFILRMLVRAMRRVLCRDANDETSERKKKKL